MSRKETDQFIRALADATQLDFYYVERMLSKFVENEVEDRLTEIENDTNRKITTAIDNYDLGQRNA